jgi:hypothetical protein
MPGNKIDIKIVANVNLINYFVFQPMFVQSSNSCKSNELIRESLIK